MSTPFAPGTSATGRYAPGASGWPCSRAPASSRSRRKGIGESDTFSSSIPMLWPKSFVARGRCLMHGGEPISSVCRRWAELEQEALPFSYSTDREAFEHHAPSDPAPHLVEQGPARFRPARPEGPQTHRGGTRTLREDSPR